MVGLQEDYVMSKQGVGNDGAALFEGSGAGVHSGVIPVVEECGGNPFGGNVQEPIRECLQTWLNASADSRFTPGAIHNLRETLTLHQPDTVKAVILEEFCRSDQEAIKLGLEAAGLVKNSGPAIIQESPEVEPEDVAQLLREAVVYLPHSESVLRERIEKFLADA
jgi:hypothetical protein